MDYSAGLVELARNHVNELLEIDPKGPYRFAGYSFGGLVAYEIACQVRELEYPVEFLMLLDSTPPYGTKGAVLVDGDLVTQDNSAGSVGTQAGKSVWKRFRETPVLGKPAWI